MQFDIMSLEHELTLISCGWLLLCGSVLQTSEVTTIPTTTGPVGSRAGELLSPADARASDTFQGLAERPEPHTAAGSWPQSTGALEM